MKWIKRIAVGIVMLAAVFAGIRYACTGNAGSPLKGKTILFLGSSVTYGKGAGGQSFVELFARQDGVNAIKEAVNGTTLVDECSELALMSYGNGDSYVKRLKNYGPDVPVDCLVCQLSTNDAAYKKELGECSASFRMDDFDTKTITGAMEYIIAYAKETWNCPVVFYTGAYFESPEYSAMTDRLYELQEKWDIGIIDLYTDEAFNAIDEKLYQVYMADAIHPTKTGYERWWMPKLREGLEEILSE